MMILAIFLVGLGVSFILGRQEKKHWQELELEYRRAGLDLPKRVPRLNKTEAWANIVLGVLLLVAGTFFVLVFLNVPGASEIGSFLPFASVLLAGGAALVILGMKALGLHGAVREK